MALTADEKEAIMAARGEGAAAQAIETKIKRYDLRFADGRGATMLDMNGDDPAAVIEGTKRRFGGDLLSIARV